MASEHRTKTYLFRSLLSWAYKLCHNQKIGELMPQEVSVEYADRNQLTLRIVDGNIIRRFTVKITENVT